MPTKDPLVGLTPMDPIGKVVKWANDFGPRSDPSIPILQDIVTVSQDGAWREEIEIELRDLVLRLFLCAKDPNLSLSHYNSTLVLLLPNHDLNSYVNPEPQLRV